MNIGYEFKNKELLRKALTHISYANNNNIESNQRLEFLGDSILSFVVAEYIYKEFKDLDEGRLTEVRAAAVCEKSLAEVSKKLRLGEMLIFDTSEKKGGGAEKPSILCDTFEAVLGAIYLDGGIEPAKKWIMDNLKSVIDEAKNIDFTNYKSEIQSYYQKRDKGSQVVKYELINRSGPDHRPTFEVNAIYKNKIIGRGTGNNLKAAEQNAAKEAYLRANGGKNEKI